MTILNDIRGILNNHNIDFEHTSAAEEIAQYVHDQKFLSYAQGCKDTEYDYNQEN